MSYGPFWSRNGVLFEGAADSTLGPTEYLPAIQARGYGYVLFDPSSGEWGAERTICQRIGLNFGCWKRVRASADLQLLLDTKRRWPACKAVGFNNEIGNGDGRGDTRDAMLMHETLFSMSHAGTAIEITDGWADPRGHWEGFRHWCGAVECFPEAYRPYEDVHGCILHAGAFFREVVACLGSYGTVWKGRLPVLADYNVPSGVPHLVFLGDTVQDWSQW